MSGSDPSPNVERKACEPWTKEAKEVLKEFYHQGKTVEFIAHELGRSPAAVHQHAWRMGLERPRSAFEPDPNTEHTLKTKRLSEKDIASRISSLLGLAPTIEVESKPFTDEELLEFTDKTTGLVTFLRVLLGVELQDYQLAICEKLQGPRNICVVSGRQSGKSLVIACFALWESIVRPNSKTVCVSAAERQSFMLSDRILGFIARSDQLYSSVAKASREELRFRNNSVCHFLSSTGLIRGYHEVSRIFVDEARDVPDSTYDSVTPMMARTGGTIAIFSTPLGRVGHLWEVWNSPLYEHIHVRSDQNQYLDPEFLKGEQERMSKASYACEFEGLFQSSQQNYFDPVSIAKSLRDYDMPLQPEKGKTYSVGWDPARKIDSSVATVLSRDADGALAVAYIRSFDNVNFVDQLPEIVHLRDIFSGVLVVEETGLGLGPCDSLERMGIKIERFKTSNESKARAFDALRSQLDKRNLIIPMTPYRLKHQLELLEYEAMASGAIRIGSPSRHDDFVSSLVLANWGFQMRPKLDPARFLVMDLRTMRR